MSEIEWDGSMGEISGFGGSYEQACRDMVLAGARWLENNPDADPDFEEVRNVFGVVRAANSDAEALAKRMRSSVEGTPTGAMLHACVGHVETVHEIGWDRYVERMRETAEADRDEQAVGGDL